jgi:MFS family permease
VAYVSSSSATALPRIASVRCSPPSGFGAFADSSYRIFKPSHFKAGLRRHSYWLKVGCRTSFRKQTLILMFNPTSRVHFILRPSPPNIRGQMDHGHRNYHIRNWLFAMRSIAKRKPVNCWAHGFWSRSGGDMWVQPVCLSNRLFCITSVVAMIQIISQATRLEDRPRLYGLFGAVFGLSPIIGPLIGGGFTDHVRCLSVHLIPAER